MNWKAKLELHKKAVSNLTPVQRRRYELYIQGYKVIDIALDEDVTQQAVTKSLLQARKKIKKNLGGDL